MKKPVAAYIFFVFLLQVVCHGQVSLNSLLEEMVDRSAVARFPEPAFVCKQVSSYDRDSISADKPGWFANWDRSQFIRTEEFQGRTEHVLMDADGPGAVVRFWGTWHGPGGGEFSNGTLRVYLDNKPEPVIEGPIMDVISGGKLVGEPLSRSLSPTTRLQHRAHNLYLPIPYAKHCKITYETDVLVDRGARKGEALYYQINYRTYSDGTKVETFSMDRLAKAHSVLTKVQKKLNEAPAPNLVSKPAGNIKDTLQPGQSRSVKINGPAAISALTFNVTAKDIEQALRSTVLEIHFDGHRTVWCPVGDFFGTGHKINPHQTWYTKVTADGTMNSYWLMPFEKTSQITVHNYGSQQVDVKAQVQKSAWRWNKRSMYFHANWKSFKGMKVRGGGMGGETASDLNYIDIQGQGVYVGDTLTLFNGAAKWWGEGDEKIYVDGETFPSHFGTGTEDYYGYAWCRPEFFEAPFHAQPNGSGNLAGGFAVNSRYRALDTIPFTKSLRFDMEMWHWATTWIDYAPSTFWYAFKGATDNGEVNPEKAAEKVVKVGDVVIEGETAQLRKVTGGFTETQSGAWGTSDGKHLWWTRGKEGDELAIAIQIKESGQYEAVAQMITAVDYGRFRILLDGVELSASEDFYVPEGVHVKRLEAGVLHLEKGEHVLSFTILEKNPDAKPGNMLGIDCIELTRVD